MKVLLDENLPHDLRLFIVGHEVFTVSFMGWAGVQNGELLRLAFDAGFQVFVTMDSGVEYQQSLRGLGIGVVVLVAVSNKLDNLMPLLTGLLVSLETVSPGKLEKVLLELS